MRFPAFDLGTLTRRATNTAAGPIVRDQVDDKKAGVAANTWRRTQREIRAASPYRLDRDRRTSANVRRRSRPVGGGFAGTLDCIGMTSAT